MKLSVMLAGVLVAAAACSDRAGEDQARQSVTAEQPRATSGTAAEPRPATAAPEKPETAPKDTTEPAAPQGKPATPRAEPPTTQREGVNADALVLRDFSKRIDAYMDVRKRAADEAPKLKETNDPKKIISAQNGQAERIRVHRADARPGDIFTPEIRSKIRRLLAPELKGEDGRDVREVLKDDAPSPGSVPFKVNAKYPEGAPLPTVPASILLNLPTLPKGLEYRVIGKHLILLDVDADMIVDYIPNAIA